MTAILHGEGFGALLRERRNELRMTLRTFAERAGLDPGNASRYERGRLGPPQDLAVLNRIGEALEWSQGSEGHKRLIDVAALSNGRLPDYVMSDEEVMESLPVLFRTLQGNPITPEQLEELIERIRDS